MNQRWTNGFIEGQSRRDAVTYEKQVHQYIGSNLISTKSSVTDEFKVTVYEPLPEAWLGISVAIDSDDDPNNGAVWWGTNKIKFDRLASAFVFRTGDEWQGYAGVGDSDSIAHGDMTNITRDVRIAVNRDNRWIALGVPRASLGPRPTVRVMATVGSMVANNDDVPNTGMVSVAIRR